MMDSVFTLIALFTMGVSASIEISFGESDPAPVPDPAGFGAGSVSASKPQIASNKVPFFQSETTSQEDVKVWTDVRPVARMQNFPPTYAGGFYDIKTADSHTTPKHAQVKFVCPPNAGKCEVVVFVYECSPCPGKKQGLQQYLMQDKDYHRTRCAPTFTLGKSPTHHRMTAYVKSIPEDSIETIVLPNAVDFIAFGMSNGGRPECSWFGGNCEVASNLRCEWKPHQESCVLRQCIQQGPSPSGGCDINTCALDQLEL